MPRKKEAVPGEKPETKITDEPVSLAALMSKKATFNIAPFWIVGDTPLIVHAWSEKAKREMLAKQVGAIRAAREKRDPNEDYLSSLYTMEEGVYGFPITGIKNCFLAAAHKDKNIPRSAAMSALFLEADMVRIRPALQGAVCDMPLTRIWGSEPEMREDMVKIGSGLNKVASLAYRAQFKHWAFRIRAKFNPDVLPAENLAFLVQESGRACGLGEWRNERRGVFGAFHLATVEEQKEWERFAAGNGPIPISPAYEEVPLAAE